MKYIAGLSIWLLVILCVFGPFVLTFFNIINLFKKKKIKEDVIDILTFVFGIILSTILYKFMDFKDYIEPIYITGVDTILHAPIASWSMPTVIAIVILGMVSYVIIKVRKLDIPPLIIVLSISGIMICSIFMLVFIIQILKNIYTNQIMLYFIIFPINYILCSIRAVIEVINYYKKKEITTKEYNSKILSKCNKLLNNISAWPILALIFVIPLSAILICILVLFGQRPDEAIQAFLETSDWTLSQKISPPPVEYDAHYLCTVSLKGHKELVKPIRFGIRRGNKIVVNRQLCIANAFEELIQEKTPKIHHFIRYIYDKYGYPLSKHIKTAKQADITYILMKPLEWIFLIVLYLFDQNPENRIAMQYTGKNAHWGRKKMCKN